MVKELSYGTISHVIESWEQVRRIENYQEVVGATLVKHLFEHCPGARPCFGFYVDAKADSSELLQNARFQAQAKYITEMLDTALDLLGPDVELLSKSMLELGAKSAQHGVKPEMSPFLRKALGYTLRKNLGKEQFTDAVKRSWQETYDALSEEVIKGQANA